MTGDSDSWTVSANSPPSHNVLLVDSFAISSEIPPCLLKSPSPKSESRIQRPPAPHSIRSSTHRTRLLPDIAQHEPHQAAILNGRSLLHAHYFTFHPLVILMKSQITPQSGECVHTDLHDNRVTLSFPGYSVFGAHNPVSCTTAPPSPSSLDPSQSLGDRGCTRNTHTNHHS